MVVYRRAIRKKNRETHVDYGRVWKRDASKRDRRGAKKEIFESFHLHEDEDPDTMELPSEVC